MSDATRNNTVVSAALSGLQYEWIAARMRHGVCAVTVLGIGKRGVIFLDADDALEGVTRVAFERHSLQAKDIALSIAQYTLEGRPLEHGYRKETSKRSQT